jgi:hypothetical protein
MKGRVTIKKNSKGRAALERALKRIDSDRPIVKVGLLAGSSAKREDGLSNPELGVIHEFGTSRIPARPFLRPAIRKHADEYTRALEGVLKRALNGEDYERGLKLIGQKASADVKNFVTRGPAIPPPNAPATLARKEAKRRPGSKGAVRTLVDTGRMVGSISYEGQKGSKK